MADFSISIDRDDSSESDDDDSIIDEDEVEILSPATLNDQCANIWKDKGGRSKIKSVKTARNHFNNYLKTKTNPVQTLDTMDISMLTHDLIGEFMGYLIAKTKIK
jgi:hypothetical protein